MEHSILKNVSLTVPTSQFCVYRQKFTTIEFYPAIKQSKHWQNDDQQGCVCLGSNDTKQIERNLTDVCKVLSEMTYGSSLIVNNNTDQSNTKIMIS